MNFDADDDDGLKTMARVGPLSQVSRRPPAEDANSDLLIDLRSDRPTPRGGFVELAGRKNLSCSEYECHSLTGEDIIRAGRRGRKLMLDDAGKLRSHSQPDDENSLRDAYVSRAKLANKTTTPFDDFAGFVSSPLVPPNLSKTALPLPDPSLIDHSVAVVDSAATIKLNGYIRHEPVVSEKREHVISPTAKKQIGQQDVATSEESSSSEDEVFQSSSFESDKRPLLTGGQSNSKRVRFSTKSERVKIMTLNDLDDEMGPKIRRGRTWKRRCTFLLYCLLANLFGVALAIFVWNTTKGTLFLYGPTRTAHAAPPSVCPKLKVEYLSNRTVSDEENIQPLDGNSKLVRLKKGVWLFIVPFGYDCAECRNGLAAFRTGGAETVRNVEFAWVADVEGKIADYSCGVDIDLDGVADCAVVTKNPSSVQLISAARGLKIYRIFSYDYGGRQLFLPQWMDDRNGDGIPEMLVTAQYREQKDVTFQLFESELLDNSNSGRVNNAPSWSRSAKVIKFTGHQYHKVTRAVTEQSVTLWRWRDSVTYVAAVFQTKLGIFLWDLNDFLGPKLMNVRTVSKAYQFDFPLGIFVDVDDDGGPELVACTKNGTVVVLLPNTDRLLWNFSRPDADCISRSLAAGHFLLRLGIVVDFKHRKTGAVETLLLDAVSGRLERLVSTSSSTFDAGPVVIRLNGPSQHKLIQWTIGSDSMVRLAAFGFPWKSADVPTIFQSDYVKPSKFVTQRNDRLRIHEYNVRFAGSLYADEKAGDFVDMMFATNIENANIVIHNVSCWKSRTELYTFLAVFQGSTWMLVRQHITR